MSHSITVHNNLALLVNAQIEPIDASMSRESLLQTGFTIKQSLTCISCGDENDGMSFTAPCNNSYCDDCLPSYVKSALEPDGVFPPLCCNLPITLQSARAYLHHDLVKRYEEKYAEIIAACSLLCAQPGCCVVIPQENIVKDLGHCLACNNYTCTRCRLQGHKGKPCPTDAEQEGLMKLAKEEGWQVYYRCNNMIELNFGCNHMTRNFATYVARSGRIAVVLNSMMITMRSFGTILVAFADRVAAGYLPGYRRRTVFRAERAVERYAKHLRQTWGRPDPRSRSDQIQEVRDEVENGCDHGYWHLVQTTRKEPGHCKLCKYVGYRFIYQCVFCTITSCWACHTDAPPEYRREEEEEEEQQQQQQQQAF